MVAQLYFSINKRKGERGKKGMQYAQKREKKVLYKAPTSKVLQGKRRIMETQIFHHAKI